MNIQAKALATIYGERVSAYSIGPQLKVYIFIKYFAEA